MKRNAILTTVLGVSILFSCTKENNSIHNSAVGSDNILQSAVAVSSCDLFAYPDSVFYLEEIPNDYIVHTVTPLQGTFGCYPNELKIDPANGDLDITESETGLKYLIWYVPTGTHDTCKKFITVAGIDYTDSIYTLKNNPSLATPVYNATPGAATACTGNCEFDDGNDDDDGDGFADEPPAGQEVIPQGIAMDKSTGAINLKQSIKNGALGDTLVPGAFKDFVLNYRISDGSNKTLNKLNFRLYYFKKQSQIPKSLLKQLQAKKQQVLLNNQFQANPATVSYSVNMNAVAAPASGKGQEVKCRPPYIIIVQN